MDSKQFRSVQIKSADQGKVSAVFATFNVIDKDGDVTLPGAFTDGQEVSISAYQHTSWGGALPVGKGLIRTTKSEAIMDGEFFMDTTAGRDTFNVLKQLGGRQEWSYGYDTLDSAPGKFDGQDVNFLKKMFVHEVSPVMVGAGINTRTLAMKARKEGGSPVETSEYLAAIRPHETPVTVKRWDGPEVVDGIPDDASIDDLRAIHAHVDAAADPTLKSSYLYPHHHGEGAEANLRACLIAVGDLNSTKSAHLTDAERRSAYNHLAQHLSDGDREVPELRDPGDPSPLKFHEEAATVMAGVSGLIQRASEVMALRRSKGKAISASTLDILGWLYEDTRTLRGLLDSPQEDAQREYARYVKSQLRATTEGEDTP